MLGDSKYQKIIVHRYDCSNNIESNIQLFILLVVFYVAAADVGAADNNSAVY